MSEMPSPWHNVGPPGAGGVTQLRIELDALSPAERRDLANALLRAAWSAVLEDTRIVLLDLLVEVDDTVLGEPREHIAGPRSARCPESLTRAQTFAANAFRRRRRAFVRHADEARPTRARVAALACAARPRETSSIADDADRQGSGRRACASHRGRSTARSSAAS